LEDKEEEGERQCKKVGRKPTKEKREE